MVHVYHFLDFGKILIIIYYITGQNIESGYFGGGAANLPGSSLFFSLTAWDSRKLFGSRNCCGQSCCLDGQPRLLVTQRHRQGAAAHSMPLFPKTNT